MAQFIIPTIFSAVDMVSGPVLRMQATMRGLTTLSGEAGAVLQRNLRSISTDAMQVATSTGMMAAAILIPLGLATKAAMDFEKQMTNVATLVDTTKESMDAMGDSVLEIASRVPVKIHDLTEALYQIRSAGIPAAQAMHVLETSAKLSVAGLSTATDATKAVTSAMVSFKGQGLTADQIANSFFLTVKEGKTKMEALNESFGNNATNVAIAGVKLQEFNALTAALTNTGMSASEAQNAIRMSVLGLIRPTTQMNMVFKKLGVTTGEELIKKMGGLDGALDAVRNTAAGTHVEMARLFNRTGFTAFNALTTSLSEQAKANIKEQMEGLDNLTTAYQKQLGTTAAQSQLAKNNIVTLAIRIGDVLLPALTALFQVISPVIKALSDFAQRHRTITSIVVGSIGIFGLFAAVVAVISFTVSTVTKAIWLWRGALKALELIQAAVNIRTAFFAASLATQFGVITIIAIALTALISTFVDTDDIISRVSNGLQKSKTGFEQIREPINNATIAMEKYNAAMEAYNNQQDKRARDRYDAQVNPISHHFKNLFTDNPIRGNMGGQIQDTLVAPRMQDFYTNIADTSKIQMTDQPSASDGGKYTVDNNGNLKITIDNKTGNKIDVSNIGAIPISISQTGTYNKK